MNQQLLLDLLPPATPTFDNYLAGPNADAVAALRESGAGRGIYLWGAPGTGRSHLLRAAAADRPGACFLSLAEPGAGARLMELATAADNAIPLYAVDGLSQADEAAQAALFALYNRWREAGGSADGFMLVVAGDLSPRAMPIREDLRTRLGWDLVFRLEHLSDTDRSTALQARAAERGLRLAPEVLQWMLTHLSRDMRQLGSLVDALDRYSLEQHRAITLPLLKHLLARQPED